MRGVFITGTDTDVGKTYVACLLAERLNSNGLKVIPKKPIESSCKKQAGELMPVDAMALKKSAAYIGDLANVCHYRFSAALSPVRAANNENQNISIKQLKQACTQPAEEGFLLVEGAGGFYSPLASDGLNADLAEALQLPILLIANDKLGCLSQILLTVEVIANRGLELAAVVLNQCEQTVDNGMDNAEDLRGFVDMPVYTLRFEDSSDTAIKKLSDLLQS